MENTNLAITAAAVRHERKEAKRLRDNQMAKLSRARRIIANGNRCLRPGCNRIVSSDSRTGKCQECSHEPNNPTQEQIRERCLEIQQEWSDQERRVRQHGVGVPNHWRVPETVVALPSNGYY